mmetsp:Transcript_41345/g.88058  ORF Transcript_41345/g.88058 Transcript_41345/m.88058 type:complete len:136 (+) Transcript_41345:78-485(+)
MSMPVERRSVMPVPRRRARPVALTALVVLAAVILAGAFQLSTQWMDSPSLFVGVSPSQLYSPAERLRNRPTVVAAKKEESINSPKDYLRTPLGNLQRPEDNDAQGYLYILVAFIVLTFVALAVAGWARSGPLQYL